MLISVLQFFLMQRMLLFCYADWLFLAKLFPITTLTPLMPKTWFHMFPM